MASDNTVRRPVLNAPAGQDQAWREKVAQAKAARDQGKALRAGKPTSFRLAVGRSS